MTSTTSLIILLNLIFNSAPSECRFVISSGHRSKEHNRKVGGAKNSYHLKKGRAYDVVTNCKKWLISNSQKKGLTTIEYKKHVHIDNRKDQKCLIRGKSGFSYCKDWR